MVDDALIVREVAAAVGLREGEGGVRAVIAALARLEPVSIRRLSRTVALPVPIVASVCGELRKRIVVADERPAQLTSAGRRLFGDGRLCLPGTATCPTCAGRGVVSPGEFSGIARELARLVEKAPPRRTGRNQRRDDHGNGTSFSVNGISNEVQRRPSNWCVTSQSR